MLPPIIGTGVSFAGITGMAEFFLHMSFILLNWGKFQNIAGTCSLFIC